MMNDDPLVSIGLPVRNGGPLLEKALRSLLGQTERRIEVIVSDNCSTDDTEERVRRLAAHDRRLRVVRHPENIGMVPNFEFVLKEARGEFFMWAAHDDSWQPTFVEALVGALQADREAQAAMSATARAMDSGDAMPPVRFVGEHSVDQPWWRLALSVARGSPHHLYIYGLYRTAFLRRLASTLPRVPAGDRLFALCLVLSARLAYVDQPLYNRQITKRTLAERYKDEDFGARWANPLRQFVAAARMAPMILQSPVIPPGRKSLTPVLMAAFLGKTVSPRVLAYESARFALDKVKSLTSRTGPSA